MLIEIKNLPNGRNIKHINVDITFDESGPIVQTKIAPSDLISSEPIVPENETINECEVESINNREQKPIPDEMKDAVF